MQTGGHSSVEHVCFSSPVPDEQGDQVFEETESSPEHRYDRKPVQLERRGVTPQTQDIKSALNRQGFLFAKELIWKESIVAKLDEAHRNELADRIRNCHLDKTVRMCRGCRKTSVFWNRCDINWCPICTEKLARERRESVEWWTKQIRQPKHVVLTARNTNTFDRGTVLRMKDAFTKLRRRKFARNWQGGFYSLEVTNESRGWHLHMHILVDSRWIDASELARQWADCIGDTIAIVKVKDARENHYLKEVTKYAVKGNDLAGWSTPDIISLIEAFEGVRTFGVFGSLYGKRTEWKEFLEEVRANRVKCDCGCTLWKLFSESEWQWETEIAHPEQLHVPKIVQIESNKQKELAL